LVPRPSYLLLLGLLSGVVGVAVGCYGDSPALAGIPGAVPLAGFVASAPAAPWIAGTAAGLVVFLALGFFLPAIIDGWGLEALSERLKKLEPAPAPEALRSAFGKSPLAGSGQVYAAQLWQKRAAADADPGDTPPPWRSSLDPETVFRAAGAMRASVGRLFVQVSLALTAVGIASFALLGHGASNAPAGSTAQGATDALPAATALSAGPLSAATVSMAIVGLGLAAFLGVRLLSHIRGQLVSDVAYLCRVLFPPAASEYLAERMAAAIAQDGAAGRAAVVDGFAASMNELKNNLATHDRRIATSVATAVQRVVQPITTSVQDMLTKLEGTSTAHAEQVLQAVLNEFLSGFQQRFGTQAAELGEILAGTRQLAEELRQSLAASEKTLTSGTVELSRTVLESVRDAVEVAVAQQTEAMQGIAQGIGDTVAETGAALDRLSARSNETMLRWTERTEALARAVLASSTEEMTKTAAAFNRVHSILETLSMSVLPAVNKLVTSQERLQVAVASSSQSAQSSSVAATDLAEAARIVREMVEGQIQLTRELAQLANGGTVPTPARPAALPTPTPAPGSDLARAIDDLRAETDDERRSLPNL
jgi:hypothetical protein